MKTLELARKNKMRDSQRDKLYSWERKQDWWGLHSNLSDQQCIDVVKKLNRIYKRKVKLKFKNGIGSSWYHIDRTAPTGEIVLRRVEHQKISVLLHEYAHALTDDKHGKDFVSTYCNLLHYLHPNQPSLKSLAQSLNQHGIKFLDFDKTKSKLSKRLKPFDKLPDVPLKVPTKQKRISAKQRVKNILAQWENPNDCFNPFYHIATYEHIQVKYLLVNGIETGNELWTWKEAEQELLQAIQDRLHYRAEYNPD